jgi:hypothetical protein
MFDDDDDDVLIKGSLFYYYVCYFYIDLINGMVTYGREKIIILELLTKTETFLRGRCERLAVRGT